MVDMCDVAIDGEGFRSRKKEQLEREWSLWGGI
jgi:hypothetical protein